MKNLRTTVVRVGTCAALVLGAVVAPAAAATAAPVAASKVKPHVFVRSVELGNCRARLESDDNNIRGFGRSRGNRCDFWLEYKRSGNPWQQLSGKFRVRNDSERTRWYDERRNTDYRVCLDNLTRDRERCSFRF
jgi:hypothetical protein